MTAVTDQANNTVQYTYDAANQLKSVIQTASPNPQNTTAYNYDANGNLINLTDANSHTTQNGFDVLNQLKQETMPSGQVQTRTYDAAGNLISLTDYNGRTTIYAYDTLNRLIAKTPDPSLNDSPVSFTYTPTGQRSSMTDASGTAQYTHDNLDRLKSKATPQGTLSYTYDMAGNVASMASNNTNGVSVAYTYDNLNRLSTVVDNRLAVGQNTTTYAYDPANNLATMTYPNGLQSTFTYDDLNRVKAMSGYQYQLGPTGSRRSASEPSGRTLNWSYDGIYRLTSETISLDPHSKNGSVSYGLDPVGNRLSQTASIPGISTGNFSYDANDRLSTEQYDHNGNTIVSGARTFTYDFENRLKSMNNGAVTITYDGDGNRVAKTVGGVTTRYLVDGLNPTGDTQVVEEIVGGAVTRTYTYGTLPINQNQLTNGVWTPSFYGTDGMGSVRLLTDPTGAVTDTFDYDAWGNAVNVTGSTPNVYLYRGEQYDPDLGLYYLRARYMNPSDGRFLSMDPADGNVVEPPSFHKYLYASGDPVNGSDPTGLATDDGNPAGRAFFTPLAGGYGFIMPGWLTFPKFTLAKPGCRWNADPGDPGDPGDLGGPGVGGGTQPPVRGPRPYSAATPFQLPVPRPGPVPVPPPGPILVPPQAPQPGGGSLGWLGDALGMACRLGGLLLSTAQPLGGPEEQVMDQRQKDYDAYKKHCSESPPPGLNPCDTARWKLQRNIDCRNMRQAWDDKYYPGRHQPDIDNLDRSIKNLEEWIRKNCK